MAATAADRLRDGRTPTAREIAWGGVFGGIFGALSPRIASALEDMLGFVMGGVRSLSASLRLEIESMAGRRMPQVGSVARPGMGGAALPEGFTLPVPEGIPEDWIISPTRSGGGMKIIDPRNKHNNVRVMPGDPTSPYPNSQRPYVMWRKDGVPLDVEGRKLPTEKCPEAHIPYEVFKFDGSKFR